MHEEPLAECLERNKRIGDKLDWLIEDKKITNGRWQKHLEDSADRIAQIARHEEMIKDLLTHKTLLRSNFAVCLGCFITIVASIIGAAFKYGQLYKTVDMNTGRILRIEQLHFSKENK